MCGIAGIFANSFGQAVAVNQLDSLNEHLGHRGPDGRGTWLSSNRRVGLAHTRLAIIDLSTSGAQPMHSEDGRYHLVFNGEIYNYLEIRESLRSEGIEFSGTSDTEVLLKFFVSRGPEGLTQLDGMFAFALYDSHENSLYCARDPLGEKPLYYTQQSGFFAFASETRALVGASLASKEPSLEGVAYLLRQGSIPPPFTHLRDVKFLEPGHWIRVGSDSRIDIRRRYWKIPFSSEANSIVERGEALELVTQSLRESVARRARADVPVAAFLSGGVDSAAVCAFLVAAGVSKLQTFTVTLPGQARDEGREARMTADYLGTRHTEVPLELDAHGDWLEEALAAMDVPSIDGPNTWLVSRAVASRGVKVACSGVGGDELFFGYPSFELVPRLYQYARILTPLGALRTITGWTPSFLPNNPKVSRAIEGALAGGSIAALWFTKRGFFSEAAVRELLSESIFHLAKRIDPLTRLQRLGCPSDIHPMRQVSFYELTVYMHDQLLRDTDCMSMAHSLEVRLPLIAKPLVETVASLSAKVLGKGGSKSLLRDILRPMLPKLVADAPKRGFTLNWPNLLRRYVCPAQSDVPDYIRFERYAHLRNSAPAEGAIPLAFPIDALTRNYSNIRNDSH